MVKFLKVRVMKTIAPSSHPHVRSPRRRPPAGFPSARARAPSRLFFVATQTLRADAPPPPTTVAAPTTSRDSVIARRRHLRAASRVRPRFRDDAERTPVAVARAVAREMPRARGFPGAARRRRRGTAGLARRTHAREAAFPPDRGRAVVFPARAARAGPHPRSRRERRVRVV